MNANGGTVGGTVVLEGNSTIQGSGSTFSGLIINNSAQAQFGGAHSPLGIVGEEPIGANGYNYHKVTFDTAGGTMEYPVRYFCEGGNISNQIVPAPRAGYFFAGWYNGKDLWDHAKDKVTGEMTLTAHWTVCDHSGHTGAKPTCTTSVICTECGGTISALGHDWGAWTSNNNDTHTRICKRDTTHTETKNCADGNKDHLCDLCGKVISNHADTNKDHKCDLCDKLISNHKDGNKDHKCDLCGKLISNHKDGNKDHKCDLCGKLISNHEDANNDHKCDLCGKLISNHEDTNKDHKCDLCGKLISNHEDTNKDHKCDLCGKLISNHEDTNKDHKCDLCGKLISNHKDGNNDHKCDLCDKLITNHTGGTATCKGEALCEICGKSYGGLAPDNHTNLIHVPAKAATRDAEGNTEYWYCDGCDRYYSDAAATRVIAKADTVTEKLPDESKSPQTAGQNSLVLWTALLFISGGVLAGAAAVKKKSGSVE